MEPKVSVLIPGFNAGIYLSAAIDSVFRQTYKHWHLIVVDDASTDNSLKVAEQYVKDSRVTLIRNAYNVGQSKSLNIGLALIHTPYTIQLDSDDCFFPDTLETLVNTAEQLSKRVAVISGNLKLVIEDAEGNVIKEDIWKNRSFSDRYAFLLANGSQWPRFYRTEALISIGGWPTNDPYEGRYMEDRQILLRLIEDYQFHWIDHLLYLHRRHCGNQTNLTQIYSEMTEWTIRNVLIRWGNKFEPIFRDDAFGRKRLVSLLPKT